MVWFRQAAIQPAVVVLEPRGAVAVATVQAQGTRVVLEAAQLWQPRAKGGPAVLAVLVVDVGGTTAVPEVQEGREAVGVLEAEPLPVGMVSGTDLFSFSAPAWP